MSPRTGRPPKENPKNGRITIRLTEEEQKTLCECMEKFGTSNAEILRRGLTLMDLAKANTEARQLLDAMVLLNELIKREEKEAIPQQIKQIEYNFAEYLGSIKNE